MESTRSDDDIPGFEVDSIELATPDLFSNDDDKAEISNKEIIQETELEMFEQADSKENSHTKEPEMFDQPDLEEDFEIPAFLRKQKN